MKLTVKDLGKIVKVKYTNYTTNRVCYWYGLYIGMGSYNNYAVFDSDDLYIHDMVAPSTIVKKFKKVDFKKLAGESSSQ